MFKIKENNIKLYKINLFNPINSSKSKKDINIINEDEEQERKIRENQRQRTAGRSSEPQGSWELKSVVGPSLQWLSGS